jgi:hypothetical protein
VENGVKQYEAKLKDREIRLISMLASKHNIELNINKN